MFGNCIKCFGTKSFDICISCANWPVLKNEKGEKIKNVIKEIYNSTDNENIQLFDNKNYIESTYLDIIKNETIDNKEINPPLDNYLFGSRGEHEVIFYLNLDNCDSLAFMFSYTINLISISLINFDDHHVTNLQLMFVDCFPLISVDFSNFNVENVENMEGLFISCYSLK